MAGAFSQSEPTIALSPEKHTHTHTHTHTPISSLHPRTTISHFLNGAFGLEILFIEVALSMGLSAA